MKLKYLETSEPGLRWMRAYYRQNPDLNRDKAVSALVLAELTLQDYPMAGEKFEDFIEVSEYKIHGTAFSFLYTVSHETIWIIDVRDQRGRRSAAALSAFNAELRKRHGL